MENQIKQLENGEIMCLYKPHSNKSLCQFSFLFCFFLNSFSCICKCHFINVILSVKSEYKPKRQPNSLWTKFSDSVSDSVRLIRSMFFSDVIFSLRFFRVETRWLVKFHSVKVHFSNIQQSWFKKEKMSKIFSFWNLSLSCCS